MIHFFERKPILTIILVGCLLLLPNLSFLEVTIMEARNFITAREMVTDGQWSYSIGSFYVYAFAKAKTYSKNKLA